MRKSQAYFTILAVICIFFSFSAQSTLAASGLPVSAASQVTSGTDTGTQDTSTIMTSRGPISVRPSKQPTTAVVPAVTNLTTSSTTVTTYTKFEVTFNIPTTTAINLQFPYDPQAPAGLKSAQGISVDGLYTTDGWKTSVAQPAFIYQGYDDTLINNTEHLYPTGDKVWKLRFTPAKPGVYSYKIRIVDASGTRYFPASSDLSFKATAPLAGNHGFVGVSSTDARYFQFSDGTPFIGIGTNTGYDAPRDKVSDLTGYITKLSQNGGNFLRTWFSDISLYGSAWSPWNSHHQPYDGYIPGNGMSYDDAYNGNQFSMKLDTSNPCLFQGWFDNVPSLPNKTYQLMVRAKINGLTGSGNKYGFTVKSAQWLDKGCTNTDNGTYLLPRVTTSNNNWQEFKVTFTTGPNQYYLNALYLALENVTGGSVLIDEVSIKQNLGNGQFGPEIVNKGKAAQQLYYSDAAADRIDRVVQQAEAAGVYLKPVVLEKNDFVFGHINANGSILRNGITQGDNNNFYAADNTEVRRLQEYYWRYLTARWGYSTAIQSWELLNEGDPYNGNHYAQADAFARFFENNDPNKHLASTSFWHSLPTSQFWSNSNYPDLTYADAHAYSGQTSWLTFNNNNIDPITGVNISNDSAVYSFAHSMSAKSLFSGLKVKPVIMGEAGLVNNGVEFGQNDTDTKGVWLHQWIWGQVNSGASQYSLYWWTDSIKKYNLYGIFNTYSKFMQGTSGDAVNQRIPVNNGKYTDIGLKVPANTFGWGQKDTTNGGAYFWMYDKNYTFTTPNGGTNVSGASVSFDGMPARTYTIEYWDTWSGQVITETRVHAGGTMTLKIPAGIAQKDVAVKILPLNGY